MKGTCLIAASSALLLYFGMLAAAEASPDSEFEQLTLKGSTAMSSRQYAQAQQSFTGALTLANSFGEKDYRLPQAIANLAEVCTNQYKYPEAEKLYRRLLDIRMRNSGPESLDTSEAYFHLGQILETRKTTYADAVELFRKDLALKKKKLGANSTEVLRRQEYLATSFWIHKRPAEAIPLFEESLALAQRQKFVDETRLGFNKTYLAECYAKTGNKQKACATAAEALLLLEKHYRPNDSTIVDARAALKRYQSNQ